MLAGIVLLSWPIYAYTRTFDFLYVNANEGSASGGHAAIKFDNEVFHFQHVDPGLLRIYRDDFSTFRFSYGYQENRTIQGHRIMVSDAVFQTLRDAFNRKLLIQNQQFELLTALNDDRRLLEDLKRASVTSSEQTPTATVDLKALGYFASHVRLNAESNTFQPNRSNTSAVLAQLKQEILDTYGNDFLQKKRQQAWKQLLALKPSKLDMDHAITQDRFEPNDYSFAQRYRNQLLNLAALDVLDAGIAPRSESLLTTNVPKLRLSAIAADKLASFRQALFRNLTKLMRSERSDWGYPLLVGMARLHALKLSIKSEQLVVLNRFHASDSDRNAINITPDNIMAIRHFADEAFNVSMAHLLNTEQLNERSYGELEVRVGALIQLSAYTSLQHSFHLPAVGATPSLPAQAELVQLPLSIAELTQHYSVATMQAETYNAKLQELYPYRLLNRNCVTEIFRMINDTFARQLNSNDSMSERDASQRLLGGYVNDGYLNMIPFVAFDEVGIQYRIDSSYRLPSYREQQIEQQLQIDPTILVDLTESNTITSSLYHWNDRDAAFLFFTQDKIWPRPLFGALNLTVATGQTLYGLITLPWDFGENLRKSLKGIFVSVPELFFFNIRKGSFPQLIPSITQNHD